MDSYPSPAGSGPLGAVGGGRRGPAGGRAGPWRGYAGPARAPEECRRAGRDGRDWTSAASSLAKVITL